MQRQFRLALLTLKEKNKILKVNLSKEKKSIKASKKHINAEMEVFCQLLCFLKNKEPKKEKKNILLFK